MVLVTNKCQNKCDDDKKTTVNTTSSTVTSTTTDPATSISSDTSESITTAKRTKINTRGNQNESEPVAGEISTANDNANGEQLKGIINHKNPIENAYKSNINDDDTSQYKSPEVTKLFVPAKLKVMAENATEYPVKEEKGEEETQSQNLINIQLMGNNKYLEEANSNTNTLTMVKIPHNNNHPENIISQTHNHQLSTDVTPHELSNALESTLNNANNTNNSVAATGLQSNFLSQFALTTNAAGLQRTAATTGKILTAKQLNQSFNMLESNNQNKSDSNLLEGTASTTSVPAITNDNNGPAKIVLICEGNSHPFQSRTIILTPNVECMVGRLIAKSKASENNAIFDCKVLSRKHAVLWYTPDGKFWVKDTKSSNGTFINDNKLADEDAELHFGDIVKFGVDVLENSRKEVHGCIIACIKLYLPDGREAISIDSSPHHSHYSGENRISYDELHRLSIYIQETTQREKILTSKLCSIQNVLDATRKNSALCWQSMITEDQLLHRIHSLEKKLQFMEKNVPENILRNDILKLIDDKTSYQHTAKEALRKVYQERCEAMQMLAKIETAYTQSDNECSLLRDQIMNSKQTLQDVNARLIRLESEYNEYKNEVARQQEAAKDGEEQRIAMLTEKLREREFECEDLKKKISELLVKHSELEDEEQLLEEQAIGKLDIALKEFNWDDDEDRSSSENDDFEKKENKSHADKEQGESEEIVVEPVGKKLEDEYAFGTPKLKSPPKRVKKKTILKWFRNSDINKNEASFDIFKAICNENDDNDDNSESDVLNVQELKDSKSITMSESSTPDESNSFSNFTSKLKSVQKNLKELESEIEKETTHLECAVNAVKINDRSEKAEDLTSNALEDSCAEEEFVIQSNGKASISYDNQVLSEENKKYILLKSSVNMLREAYNEIWDRVKETEDIQCMKEGQPKLPFSESDSTKLYSQVDGLTSETATNISHNVTVVKPETTNDCQLREQLQEFQYQVVALNEKLQQSELEAQQTLEIMQVECEDVKMKMENLYKIIETQKKEIKSLKQVINEYQNNKQPCEISALKSSIAIKDCKENDEQLKKVFELEEDPVLNALNITALECEEELITYKERLDQQEKENIDLRNELAVLKETTSLTAKNVLVKQYLPCITVIVLAIIIYFLTTYR